MGIGRFVFPSRVRDDPPYSEPRHGEGWHTKVRSEAMFKTPYGLMLALCAVWGIGFFIGYFVGH